MEVMCNPNDDAQLGWRHTADECPEPSDQLWQKSTVGQFIVHAANCHLCRRGNTSEPLWSSRPMLAPIKQVHRI